MAFTINCTKFGTILTTFGDNETDLLRQINKAYVALLSHVSTWGGPWGYRQAVGRLYHSWMWGVLLWIWNCLLKKKQRNPTYRFLADCESWFVSLALRFLPVVTMRGVWAIAVGWSGVVRCSCELLLRTIFRIPLNISVNGKTKIVNNYTFVT